MEGGGVGGGVGDGGVGDGGWWRVEGGGWGWGLEIHYFLYMF